jgi:hypothetical protein
MSILSALGMIGKGVTAGAEFDRVLEERKRRQAEEVRRQQEFERENREREGLRRSLFGLVGQEREEDASQNADALEGAADSLKDFDQGAQNGIGNIGFPFAGKAIEGAAKAVREKGKNRGTFDPDVPYEQVAQVEQRIRESRNRATDRRVTQTRLQQEAQRRRDELTRKRDLDALKVGDIEVQRGMLRRLAAQKDIGYTPDEIDGLSPEAVQRLAERSGTGELGTRDYKARQEIRIELTPPKGEGGGGRTSGGLTATDLGSTMRSANDEREGLWRDAPPALRREIDAAGIDPGMTASQVYDYLKDKPALKTDARIQRWLSQLQASESKRDVASTRQGGLLSSGERTVTPAAPAQSNNVRTPPTRPAPPAPAPKSAPAAPSDPRASERAPVASLSEALGAASGPNQTVPQSKEDWQEVYRNASAAYQEDPNDREALAAMQEAIRNLRKR